MEMTDYVVEPSSSAGEESDADADHEGDGGQRVIYGDYVDALSDDEPGLDEMLGGDGSDVYGDRDPNVARALKEQETEDAEEEAATRPPSALEARAVGECNGLEDENDEEWDGGESSSSEEEESADEDSRAGSKRFRDSRDEEGRNPPRKRQFLPVEVIDLTKTSSNSD
jgi:hypothetical protein